MHAELVDQAKRGDREAFDALARLTGDRCMAIAFRILATIVGGIPAHCADPGLCSQFDD